MDAEYSYMSIHGGTVIQPEFPEYWIILNGSGMTDTEGTKLEVTAKEILAPKTGAKIKIQCGSDLLIGRVVVKDIPDECPHVHKIPVQYTELFRRIFFFALDIKDMQVPYHDGLMSSLNTLMFSALVSAEMLSENMNETVFHVMEDINSNFLDPDYDLHTVIGKTGYTINHFRKLFKKEIGLPPVEFLTNRRLDYARDLIIQSPKPLSLEELAAKSGFRDPYYFSRVFKNREGMTPRAYTQKVKGS